MFMVSFAVLSDRFGQYECLLCELVKGVCIVVNCGGFVSFDIALTGCNIQQQVSHAKNLNRTNPFIVLTKDFVHKKSLRMH